MGIREELESIGQGLREELRTVQDTQSLEQLKVRLLGKKGSLTALLRGMGQLAPEERPKMGQIINERREIMQKMLDEKMRELSEREKQMRLEREALDITEPRDLPEGGVPDDLG